MLLNQESKTQGFLFGRYMAAASMPIQAALICLMKKYMILLRTIFFSNERKTWWKQTAWERERERSHLGNIGGLMLAMLSALVGMPLNPFDHTRSAYLGDGSKLPAWIRCRDGQVCNSVQTWSCQSEQDHYSLARNKEYFFPEKQEYFFAAT